MSAEVTETVDLNEPGHLDKKEKPCAWITPDVASLPNGSLKITMVVKPREEEQEVKRAANQDDFKLPEHFKPATAVNGEDCFIDAFARGFKSVPRLEESNMNIICCDNNFMFYMSLRTTSLIFAWIGAVLSGLGTVGCFIATMVYVILITTGDIYYQYGISCYVTTSALLGYFSIGFIAFAILLIGIIQRRPILIKGYIIYGMVLTVIHVIMIIILACATYVYPVALVFIILGCVIYWGTLYVHYLMYKDYVNASDTNVLPEEAKENLTHYRADVLDVQPC